MVIPKTFVYEGTYVSILSSTSWQDLGSPHIVPITHNMLAFNRTTSQLLWILPKLPITLGGNIFYIDVMVAQSLLDFVGLLGPIFCNRASSRNFSDAYPTILWV